MYVHGTVSYITYPMSNAKISLSYQSTQTESECRLHNGLVLKLMAIAYKINALNLQSIFKSIKMVGSQEQIN